MKNFSVIILVLLVAVLLGIHFVSFTVRETEKAIVLRFGATNRSIDEPGWNWKWPSPIEVVHKFDSRAQIYEGVIEETNTKGGDPIIVMSYVVWKIENGQKYLESVRDQKGAEEQLKGLLRNTQNTVIGGHNFSEFVNSDPGKIRFKEIEGEMLASMRDKALAEYGMSIEAVGIKQLGISEKVTKDVFDRMKAERDRKATAIIAQGTAEALRITTDADLKRNQLLVIAENEAAAIRGEGDAEAARHYKRLEADPELAMFLRNLESLKNILEKKSTIILGADTEPLELLRGIPDIKPKE